MYNKIARIGSKTVVDVTIIGLRYRKFQYDSCCRKNVKQIKIVDNGDLVNEICI